MHTFFVNILLIFITASNNFLVDGALTIYPVKVSLSLTKTIIIKNLY